VKQLLKLHNVDTDHVIIRSELHYLIGANIVNLNCLVFGGNTGPFPMVQVFHVVRPVATVRIQVELNLELTEEFGFLVNSRCTPGGVQEKWHE
jgi:hypothetical protein